MKSSEFKRILDGCFLVARAQEIFGGNLVLEVASQEILCVRRLSS